jgi:hypothetical protein
MPIGFFVRRQHGRSTATPQRGEGGQFPRSALEGEKKYIIEEQVRHVWYQRPLSMHLLKKYEYQYQQRRQYESKDEEYEHRTGKSLRKHEDLRDHWHCPFFKHY